ncbi:FADL189Wp [Eremothecium gossypii FDAG1]|nr:FADL189Wp [Eremothecium gossypii FDAG1]
MSKGAMSPIKSNPDSIRRVFSVEDNSNEIQNDVRKQGYQEGVALLSKSRAGMSNASTPQLQSAVPALCDHRHNLRGISEDQGQFSGSDWEAEVIPQALGDQESIRTVESFTLRERQHAINETHPFGIRIWKPALYKKYRSVQQAANEDIHETKYRHISLVLHLSNIVWSATVGIFLFTILYLAGLSVRIFGLLSQSASDYSTIFFKLGRYLLWPFGKVVYIVSDEQYLQEDKDEGVSIQQFYKWISGKGNRLFYHNSGADNHSSMAFERELPYGSITREFAESNLISDGCPDTDAGDSIPHRRLFGRGQWTIGRIVFYLIFHVFIQPIMMILVLVLWLGVFTIPMSNIIWNLMYHCRRHPLALDFKHVQHTHQYPDDETIGDKNVLLCTFRCAGWHYYKFTVDGTNVIVMNLISIVIFTIFDFYFLKRYLGLQLWITGDFNIFCLCLLSIIPLAFYIGQAVASISAQTSMGLGAVINAFFSTIVEVYLYCVALKQSKGLLVEGSMIGSILAAVLLLPGMSMCGGALNRKTQRYNPASAGVSSAMLIFSMLVMFVPTIFYDLYGDWDLICEGEVPLEAKERCRFAQPPLKFDSLYLHVLKPVSIICAVVLFLAYMIGLWFTLRTHAAMIWQLPISDQHQDIHAQLQAQQAHSFLQSPKNPVAPHAAISSGNNVAEEPKGHAAPNWSRNKSTWILLCATLLYAIIAEILVDCVDEVLKEIPSLNPKFLGLTVFALIPNTTEFLNAISFAMHGNVALSMEIGSAYALQVCLLQIPALVIYSLVYTSGLDHSLIKIREQMFTLVFPQWDLIACMISGFLFTYLYAEGKSNYFKGSILILLYIVITVVFYYQGFIDDNYW